MEDRKMEVIQELMGELQELMQPSESDLGERLGRAPKVEVMSAEMEEEPMDGDEALMDEGMDSLEDKLKQRLMKLRA